MYVAATGGGSSMAGDRFSFEERRVIARCRRAKMTYRELGVVLDRNPGAICREVNRNMNSHGRYWARGAQRKANVRALRPKPAKLDERRLYRMVKHRLKKWRYSPAATAADLRRVGIQISHETIYQGIYRHRFGDPRSVLCRPRRRRKRRTRTGRTPDSLGPIRLIDWRPKLRGVGHWEADLLVGKGNHTAVVVLTELVTRYTLIVALGNRTADHCLDQLVTHINRRIPRHLRKTLTFDQGREFARWQKLEKATGFVTYFCHPHSPWEKPLVESTNALLRRWFPKGTDITQDQRQIDRIARLLNNMPRRSHQWSTATIEYRKHRVATTP